MLKRKVKTVVLYVDLVVQVCQPGSVPSFFDVIPLVVKKVASTEDEDEEEKQRFLASVVRKKASFVNNIVPRRLEKSGTILPSDSSSLLCCFASMIITDLFVSRSMPNLVLFNFCNFSSDEEMKVLLL